ncbi:MAG: hypothetical protein PVJ76_10925 [Gemmatimonadota bacterium]|jgi:hypothetical protein
MDPIREGLIRFADKGSAIFQLVTRTFGFLPDGRELVKVEKGADGLQITFSDRSEEGWPPFSVNLPSNSEFSHASMGPLTRVAHWTVRDHPQAVTDHLIAHNEGFPEPDPRARKGQKFSLDDGVEVIVGGSERHDLTLLIVTQERDPDAIQEGMKARLRATAKRYGRRDSGQP